MGDIFSLAKKMERAARNGTGFNVTAEEMRLLMAARVYDVIQGVKSEELRSKCLGAENTRSEITGSTSGETAPPPPSGKSQPISREAAKSYIAALSAAA